MAESPGEPLFRLLRRIRRPVTLREIAAQCLRHVYMGDPFGSEEGCVPPPPPELFEQVNVREVDVSGIRCLIYEPKQRADNAPVMIYMHGGGFVVGSPEDSDYTTRKLGATNGSVVISVDYRLAPETVFPGALEDCMKVVEWAIADHTHLGIDQQKVFLAGDSAGGNLAVGVALQMHERSLGAKGLILLAPWLDMHLESYDSYNRLAPDGIVYDAAFMGFARAAYVRFQDWTNPLASPIFSDQRKLPPTLIVIGEDDPLVDQCNRFFKKSPVNKLEYNTYPGMPHCFYSFPNLFDHEKKCYQDIAKFVRAVLRQSRT